MANDGETRRLAAIMASDVVGFTSLMGTDEAGTLAALKTLRKELWDPKVAEHGGRVVKLMGDGQLTEFPSVANAVQCAVELQRAMARRNADIPESHRIALRVGINLGDVIIDGDDIYGDGVNVAARLETLAEPGGICISRSVRDQIRDKLLYALEDLGEQELKGVARPVRVFRVSIEETGDAIRATKAPPPPARPRGATPKPARSRRRWLIPGLAAVVVLIAVIGGGAAWWQPWVTRVEAANVANMAFPLPDKPSIAVLPFDNFSGDPAQGFLADGFTEDITTAISRLPDMFVVSRTTTQTYRGRPVTVKQVAEDLGVQFVLEGSIQRDGDRLRVNAQLIDALGGNHVWAEKYDRDISDLFAVKDEITLMVASNVGAKMGLGEREKLLQHDTSSLEAWLLLREAEFKLQRFTPEENDLARGLYQRAIDADPSFVEAHAGLASTHVVEVQRGFTDAPAEALAKALEIVGKGLAIDPNNVDILNTLTYIHIVQKKYDEAVSASAKAVEFGPNDWLAHGYYAWSLMIAERYQEAIHHSSMSGRLSPIHADWIDNVLAASYFFSGDLEKARSTYEEILTRNLPPVRESVVQPRYASVLAAMGREEEARRAIERALEVFPGMSISYQMRLMPPNARLNETLEAWRRLGLPE